MGRALDAVNAWDAEGFFEHCGYRTLTQLLRRRCNFVGDILFLIRRALLPLAKHDDPRPMVMRTVP
jgi:hypothetical protein